MCAQALSTAFFLFFRKTFSSIDFISCFALHHFILFTTFRTVAGSVCVWFRFFLFVSSILLFRLFTLIFRVIVVILFNCIFLNWMKRATVCIRNFIHTHTHTRMHLLPNHILNGENEFEFVERTSHIIFVFSFQTKTFQIQITNLLKWYKLFRQFRTFTWCK